MVFIMRHHQGLKLGEIAAALGLAEGHRQAPAARRGAPAAPWVDDRERHCREPRMSAVCQHLDGGAVELYFYDELPATEHESMSAHLRLCRDCAAALDELKIIRAALASRPDISAPSSGDWSAFMDRLDAAVAGDRPRVPASVPSRLLLSPGPGRSYIGLLVTAALLAIVTMSVRTSPEAVAGRNPRNPTNRLPHPTTRGRAVRRRQARPLACMRWGSSTSNGRSLSCWAFQRRHPRGRCGRLGL